MSRHHDAIAAFDHKTNTCMKIKKTQKHKNMAQSHSQLAIVTLNLNITLRTISSHVKTECSLKYGFY